jgi:hypothetical protein
MKPKTVIKQIVAAGDGFVIVWYSDSPDKNGNWFFTTRLIGLALVNDYPDHDLGIKEDRVFPLDDMGGYLDILEEDDSWQRIIHEDEITPELKQHWNDEAKEKVEKAKKKAAVKAESKSGFLPCKGCGKPIRFVRSQTTGKMVPLTESGLNHFLDCPKANEF